MVSITRKVSVACRHRCAGWLATTTVAALALVIGVAGYAFFIDYYSGPIDSCEAEDGFCEVYPSNTPDGAKVPYVNAGETLYIRWKFEVYRSCPVEFPRFLLNKRTRVITILEPHKGLAPKLGDSDFTTQIKIPSDMLTGVYEYHTRGIFECNPFMSREVYYPAIPFTILRTRKK